MTRPFLLLENAFLKEHPINLPLRDGPSGAEALTASGGEGASIARDVYKRQGLPVAALKRALRHCVQEARRQAAIQQVENLGIQTTKPKGTKGHER